MNAKYPSCSASSRRGVTLIEVVAGVLLLSTLLVSIILTHSRHALQVRKAQRRLAAIEATDNLLVRWFDSPHGVPLEREGTFHRRLGLAWRTTIIDRQQGQIFGADVARLEVFDLKDTEAVKPIVTIDILIESSSRSRDMASLGTEY